jgi:bacteriocin-like protein
MSKTNDTSNLDHRELTETELDTVSGGLTIQKQLDAASPKLSGGGGDAAPAIAAWNKCLGVFGY